MKQAIFMTQIQEFMQPVIEFSAPIWKVVQSAWEKYWGESFQFIVLFACLLYILVHPKEKENRKLFVGYSGIFFFIFAFPITAYIIADYCTGRDVYWRMLWILPIPIIVAYVFTKIAGVIKNKGIQFSIVAILILVIVVTGKSVYFNGNYVRTNNPQKVLDYVAYICDLINEQREEGEEIHLATTNKMTTYIRVYDPSIYMPYGRWGHSDMTETEQQLMLQLMSEDPNLTELTTLARQLNCNYIVMKYDTDSIITSMNALGYENMGQVEAYFIFKDTQT
ncbi:MAG: hypothetical protein ACK5MN_07945 [Lachnospiraceae bacterium]